MPKLIQYAAASACAAIVVSVAPAASAHGKPAKHDHSDHVIAQQLARVSRLAAAAGTSRTLTDPDRAGLTLALAADAAAIRDDATALPGAGHAGRKAAVAAAVNTTRVAQAQFRGVVDGVRVAARAAALKAAVTTLSAAATGAADVALADARTHLAAAVQHAHGACAIGLALAPAASRGDQRAARAATRAALHAARRDESAAVVDIAKASVLGG